MFPARDDTTRSFRCGICLFVLVVIACQGCAHSSNTVAVNKSGIQTDLVSQSPDNDFGEVTPATAPASHFARLSTWFGRRSSKDKFVANPSQPRTEGNDVTVKVETNDPSAKSTSGLSQSNEMGRANRQIQAPAWNHVNLNSRVGVVAGQTEHPTHPDVASVLQQARGSTRIAEPVSPHVPTAGETRQIGTKVNSALFHNSQIASDLDASRALPEHRSSTRSQAAKRASDQHVTQASAKTSVTVLRPPTPNDVPALIPGIEALASVGGEQIGRTLSPPASGPVRKHQPQKPEGPLSYQKGLETVVTSAKSQPVFKGTTKVPRVTRASFEDEIQTAAQVRGAIEQPVLESEPSETSERDSINLNEPGQAPAPQPDPPPSGPVRIPLAGEEPNKDIEMTTKDGRVSLVTRDATVLSVLNLLAEQQGLNLIAADDVIGNVSVTLTNVAFEDALNAIVAIAGCTWTQNRGIVLVSKIGGESRGGPDVQGKVVQVFPLNFIAATDIEMTIKGLLSPMGQVFISQASATDKRKTQELVVVEDIPASVSRITQYLQQVDQAPRQVMIEAHVLQVDLKDDTRHGVDWKFITTYLGRDISLKSVGFTNETASPASIFSMDGGHLDLVVEALKTTTDAKTLASPKVIVANGQEARIQIGSKLGYFVTTTTQTSTLQNVNFLNTGVLLKITPQISNDNRVLMLVSPEVSTGRISAAGLPETNTTEAMTTVLLENNGGMVIGGLIKETDSDTQDKIPILGDLWLVGRLFQRRSVARQRSEIIIVLIPHIAPYSPDGRTAEQAEILRTTTPIFQNGLQPAIRPLDPRLPDAINNPRRLRANRLSSLFSNPTVENPKPLTHFFPTDDEEFLQPSQPLLGPPVLDDVVEVQVELPPPLPATVNNLPVLEPLPPTLEPEKPAPPPHSTSP